MGDLSTKFDRPRRMSVGSPDVKAKKETVTEDEGVEKGRKSSGGK